jgi:hypothetical protein
MYDNYCKYGLKEGRLPNMFVLSIMKEKNRISSMKEISIFEEQSKQSKHSGESPEKFFVLTRTSNRPEKFNQCIESSKQINANVINYISYDTNIAKKYSREIGIGINLIGTKLHPNQYIDEFYRELQKDNQEGWILVLDDDDLISTPYLFSGISKYLTDKEKVVVWKLERPDKIIYPKNIENVEMGEIATCCYIYHTSKISFGKWKAGGIGDYDWFKYLLSVTNKSDFIWLPYALSRVNYINSISGWTAM